MTLRIGYALSSEEHAPRRLVELAQHAEATGFAFACISDHFHPWVSRQGHSPFVWGVLGAIAHATDRLPVATGVTCPIERIHPAVLAQASATAASLMPGRFAFGVGTGEHLNEHITGRHWPPIETRLDMLAEAIDVIRALWTGENVSHRGAHFTVEDARLYTMPPEPPAILVAAGGPAAAELAGQKGDGLISTAPDGELVERFRAAGGAGKPVYGQVTVCFDPDEGAARKTATAWWPNAAIPGQLSQELRLPAYFEQAAALVTEDKVAERVVCGPDPKRHLDAIREFEQAGFDHVYVHQVGPEQDAFLAFYRDEVLARFAP